VDKYSLSIVDVFPIRAISDKTRVFSLGLWPVDIDTKNTSIPFERNRDVLFED
jgi:hypothetical protein